MTNWDNLAKRFGWQKGWGTGKTEKVACSPFALSLRELLLTAIEKNDLNGATLDDLGYGAGELCRVSSDSGKHVNVGLIPHGYIHISCSCTG